MAKTFDTSRVGGGTYELAQDANGNYNLNSVGFNQVNKLNLPDLTNLDVTTAPVVTIPKKSDVADPFKKLATQNQGDGGSNQDYSGVMLKTPEVKDVSVKDAGDAMTKDAQDTRQNFSQSVEDMQTAAEQNYNKSLKDFQAAKGGSPSIYENAKNNVSDARKQVDQAYGFGDGITTPYQDAITRGQKGVKFGSETTGLQKVKSKAAGFKDSLSNLASKNIALNAIKGAAQGLGAFLGAILPPETNSQTHSKGYFNLNPTSNQPQRIAGNPANDLYAGANANATELNGYGQKRIDTIGKTISKMTPQQLAKSSLPARKEKFEKQQQEYREDRAAAKDKESGNTKTNVTGFGKSGLGRDTSGGGGDTGGGGGGRVICTDLHRTGELSTRDWIRDTKFTFTTLSKKHVKGYLLWAEPTVKHMQKYPRYRKMWKHIAHHRANDIAW